MYRVSRAARPLWRGFKSGVITPQASPVAAAKAQEAIMSMSAQAPTDITTLSNGLRVASETMKGTEMATIGVHLYTGTRFESPETNGAAHFLEHLIFKGTKNVSQHQLEIQTENMGAHLNAYTSREHTVYFARAMKKDIPKVVDLLADILQNPKLEDRAVERERDVILRELQEVNQQTDETVLDYLHEVAYQNTPLAKTILGTPENIRSLTAKDLRDYIGKHYKPHRMVIAAAGAVDHGDLVKLSEKAFGSMPAEKDPVTVANLVEAQPAYLTGSEVRVTNDLMPACHFAIAFESVGWTHPDSIAFMVFQGLLGTYDRSQGVSDVSNNRLPRSMALHADHCVSYSSFNTTYTDTGMFGVYTVAEPPEMEDVCLNVMSEMVRPVFKIEQDALERAKLHIKSTALFTLDGTQAVAEEIGRQLLVYDRRMPMSEFFARVDEVDIQKLKDIADMYIFDREIAVAAVGPIWALPDYSYLRRRTYYNEY